MGSVGYVGGVMLEKEWTQKKSDAHKYDEDVFVVGDDWRGEFDCLKYEGVEVVYLPRTPEVITTQIRQDLLHRE